MRSPSGFMSMWSMDNAKVAADGAFTLRNVAPGEYTLNLRVPATGDAPAEAVAMNLSVGTTDLEGVVLTTSTGGTMSGRLLFDGNAAPPQAASQFRIVARPVNREAPAPNLGTPTQDNGRLKPDWSFSLTGVIGANRIGVTGLPQGWAVKSIDAQGRDVTDTPLEFGGGEKYDDVAGENRQEIVLYNRAIMSRRTPMIDRRTFITTMTAAAVTGLRLEAKRLDRLGMQLYTVRDDMEKDFEGTLAKVAAIGYKEVEFAGYFKRTPEQVRDALKKAGLAAPAAHVDYPSLASDKLPAVLESARRIGHQFLVNPWIDETLRKEPDIWKRVADTFNRAGEASRKAGIQFAYHNHHFEFAPVGGKLPYELLLEQCDPALVKMELDLCWITAAGKDPLEYFKKYPGRFPLVHVKGLAKKPEAGGAAPIQSIMPDITDVGTSDIVNWKRIFAQSKQAGIQHYFVEHDVPKDPYASLKASYSYLKQLDF